MAIHVFGPQFQCTIGWIATRERGKYNHRFGGTPWTVDAAEFPVAPSTILDLDLADPRLNELVANDLDRFPLVSLLNCDAWSERQAYRLHPGDSAVEFIAPTLRDFEVLPPCDRLADPLPEVPIDLRAMRDDEIPAAEAAYWTACDSFVGGESFLRVLGAPLWLQHPIEERCRCGEFAHYVAGVGYESVAPGGRWLMEHMPFYFGEGALYFFSCRRCLIVSVYAQST